MAMQAVAAHESHFSCPCRLCKRKPFGTQPMLQLPAVKRDGGDGGVSACWLALLLANSLNRAVR